MEEVWKRIEYGNGNYYVSNFGNVKNDALMLGYGYIGTFKEISDAVKARDRALCESQF